LEYGIEQSQNLASEKLIIAVNNYKYLLRFAVFLSRCPQIGHCEALLFVDDDLITFRRNDLLFFHEFLNLLACFIGGCIVDEDNVIIGVFLHKD
jgi:hypothetical protein